VTPQSGVDLIARGAERTGIDAFVDETLGVFRVHAAGQSAGQHASLRVRWEFVKLLVVQRDYGALHDSRQRHRLSRQQWRFRRYLVGEALRTLVR
jgi:hypothetical protein